VDVGKFLPFWRYMLPPSSGLKCVGWLSSVYIYIYIYVYVLKNHDGRIGVDGLSGPIGTEYQESCARKEIILLWAMESTKRPLPTSWLGDHLETLVASGLLMLYVALKRMELSLSLLTWMGHQHCSYPPVFLFFRNINFNIHINQNSEEDIPRFLQLNLLSGSWMFCQKYLPLEKLLPYTHCFLKGQTALSSGLLAVIC
jgi:hypothetical protein